MENYADLMFTPKVSALQDQAGTAQLYADRYPARTRDGLGPNEKTFLKSAQHFYMATISETGWPYLQHRGGPKGFLKILDPQTIAFADYAGNKQFISQGNLQSNARVSLFVIDYAHKTRLKLQGDATMVPAADNPDLAAELDPKAERLTTIHIRAFDWNCPQYITPRYTQDEVTALVAPHLADRDAKIAELTAKLKALGDTP